jgi:hypothetical protein
MLFRPFWIIFTSKTVYKIKFLTIVIGSLHSFLHFLCYEDVAEKTEMWALVLVLYYKDGISRRIQQKTNTAQIEVQQYLVQNDPDQNAIFWLFCALTLFIFRKGPAISCSEWSWSKCHHSALSQINSVYIEADQNTISLLIHIITLFIGAQTNSA